MTAKDFLLIAWCSAAGIISVHVTKPSTWWGSFVVALGIGVLMVGYRHIANWALQP